MQSMLEAATAYVLKGYSVIPVGRNKQPLLKSWKEFQERRPELEEVEAWWKEWPDANIAICTGAVSGLVIIDIDKDLTPKEVLVDFLGSIESGLTMIAKTSKGWHLYFKHPGFEIGNSVRFAEFMDVRGDGGYVVAPPSIHSSGFPYTLIEDRDPAPMTTKLLAMIRAGSMQTPKALLNDGPIIEGGRTDAMTRLAGRMLKRGMPLDDIYAWLLGVNQLRCRPPLPESKVKETLEGIAKRENSQGAERVKSLDALKDKFGKWLYLVDPYWLEVAMATMVANRWHTDPLWVVFVAPPSSAKTEIIRACAKAPDAYSISSVTKNTFLSGMKQKEMSLLYQLNDKTLLIKELTTLLTMRPDDKAEIFSQLREIYDGYISKAFGSTGKKEWSGHMGLLSACTGIIEGQMLFNQMMGERMLLYRPEVGDRQEVGRKALEMFGTEVTMREEFQEAVNAFLEPLPRRLVENIGVNEEAKRKIIVLADIMTVLRCGVQRNGYTRAIEILPEPEGLPRVAKQFMLMAKALCELHGTLEVEEEQLKILERVMVSNLPTIRRVALECMLLNSGKRMTTGEISEKINVTKPTLLEHLEDLSILGVVKRSLEGEDAFGKGGHFDRGRPGYQWWIVDEWQERLKKTAYFTERIMQGPVVVETMLAAKERELVGVAYAEPPELDL